MAPLGVHISSCIGADGQLRVNKWKDEVCSQNENYSFLLGSNYFPILCQCPKARLCLKDILPGHFKGENIQISIFSDAPVTYDFLDSIPLGLEAFPFTCCSFIQLC